MEKELAEKVKLFEQMIYFMENDFEKIFEKKEIDYAPEEKLLSEFRNIEKIIMKQIVPKDNSFIGEVGEFSGEKIHLTPTGYSLSFAGRYNLARTNLLSIMKTLASSKKNITDYKGEIYLNNGSRKELAKTILDLSIESIKKENYRTKHRSVERLQRFKKFLEKYIECLISPYNEKKEDVGKIYVYNNNEEVFEKRKYFLTSNGYDIRLKPEVGNYMERYELGECTHSLSAAYAFSQVFEKLNEFVESTSRERERLSKLSEKAIEDLQKMFARELLVNKTKKIGGKI